MAEQEKLEEQYRTAASQNPQDLLAQYKTQLTGLDENQREARLQQYGPNLMATDKKQHWYDFLLKSFLDEFIIVLLALGVISLIMQDAVGGIIIFVLAFISAMMRFVQDYNPYRSAEKLKLMVHNTVCVRCGGREQEIASEQIVPGDIEVLSGGSIISGDLYLLESKDLFLSQSMFTGETVPVEKRAGADNSNTSCTALAGICLSGAAVVSGTGLGLVIKTGRDTYLGHISAAVSAKPELTNFDKGLAKVTRILMIYMVVVVIFVLIINGLFKHDWLQALMFSISVAVGITPGMLPMIVNGTLAKGAQFLAKKKTIVRNMSAIQNLGAMDVLCTDKTGTLTMDSIVLQRYIGADGKDSKVVVNYAYLNSYYSTGVKNTIDRAIITYGDAHNISKELEAYQKIDEIPYDFQRRRMSVIIKNNKQQDILITKGALESVLPICTQASIEGRHVKINEVNIEEIKALADRLNDNGMHAIAVCAKRGLFNVSTFGIADETEMVFLGLIAFLDPPKPDVPEAIADLYKAGVDVKVISGDAPLMVRHICQQVGLKESAMLSGDDIEKLDDEQLGKAVETANIFARVAPMQKQRIVKALKANGHVVGYMGDGVNDAPSLRTADVGISVDTATDVAKASSSIILLKKSLSVILDGVYEGRRIYGNIVKYMKMALSSNFGNVFSVLVASIFLPFLPMLSVQMLIQNLVYDFTQIAIPWDNVDPEFLQQPRRWDTRSLASFMNTMGLVSSFFDVATFAVLWFVMGFTTVSVQAYFQTGWFIEGLISQILIVQFIRTAKVPFIQSKCDYRLGSACGFGVIAALTIPYIFRNLEGFHFVVMPAVYYLYLAIILVLYAIAIQLTKKFYIRRHGYWL